MANIVITNGVEGLTRIISSVILYLHRLETPNEGVSTKPRAPQSSGEPQLVEIPKKRWVVSVAKEAHRSANPWSVLGA